MINEKKEEPEMKAGYCVLRLKTGYGVIINENIEIRIGLAKTPGEIHLAIRAPKEIPIRRVK